MGTKKARLSIDRAKCSPCSGFVCIGVCPQGLLELDKEKKPELVDEAACNQCGVCINLCPNQAITVKDKKAKS